MIVGWTHDILMYLKFKVCFNLCHKMNHTEIVLILHYLWKQYERKVEKDKQVGLGQKLKKENSPKWNILKIAFSSCCCILQVQYVTK